MAMCWVNRHRKSREKYKSTDRTEFRIRKIYNDFFRLLDLILPLPLANSIGSGSGEFFQTSDYGIVETLINVHCSQVFL